MTQVSHATTNHKPWLPKDRAGTFVETWVVPTIATAFREAYPKLNVTNVLERCAPALAEKLRDELHDEESQQLIHEIRTRIAVAHRDAFPADQGS
jgi:hypothetical protein